MDARRRGSDGAFGSTVAMVLVLVLSAGFAVVTLVGPSSGTPWTGPEPTPTDLVFYLHNSSTGVTVGSVDYLNVLDTYNDSQAPWVGTGSLSVGAHYDSVQFVVAPALTAPLVLNGTINATVYLNQSGSSPTGGTITLVANDVAPSGAVTTLGTGPTTPTSAIGPGGSIPTLVFIQGPTLQTSIPAGDSLQLNLTVTGNTAEHYGIWWGDVGGTYYESSVSVPASSYLTVPQVEVQNSTGSALVVLPSTAVNKTVTVVATVADPLGAYDFEAFPVEFSVVTPNGSVAVAPTPMLPLPVLAPPAAPNGTYSTSFNYSALPPGVYNFTVNATDNTNWNLVGQNTLPTYYGRNAYGWTTVSVGLPPVPVNVTVVDDHNISLPGARVDAVSGGVTIATARTNASGGITFQLSSDATYDFRVTWQGVAVGTFSSTVTTNATSFVLHAEVVYPAFHIVSNSGEPLPYPLITVIHPNGSAYRLIVGNGSGGFSLAQVPAGNFTLTVVYDDSEVVFAQPVSVSGDGPYFVTAANVFSLTIKSTDSSGNGLENVFVTVVNASTGATVASGVTPANGVLTFYVPAGTYTITGTWAATYEGTPLQETEIGTTDVTGPATATLDFKKAFPPIYETTFFQYMVPIVVLVILTILFAALWLRARGRGRRPPSQPAEWKTDGSSSPGAAGPESPKK